MAAFQIPTYTDPFYTLGVELDGASYSLDFRYSEREAVWYLAVSSGEGDLLASGIKLVCFYPLLRGRTDPRLPKGTLMVHATGDDSPPGLEDLGEGGRCVLLYG